MLLSEIFHNRATVLVGIRNSGIRRKCFFKNKIVFDVSLIFLVNFQQIKFEIL